MPWAGIRISLPMTCKAGQRVLEGGLVAQVACKANIVHQGIEPDVGHARGIEWQFDPPGKTRLRPRDREITAEFLGRVAQFLLPEGRGDAVAHAASRKSRSHSRCFARRKYQFSSSSSITSPHSGPNVAVRTALLVGEKLLLPHAVESAVGRLVNLPFVVEGLKNLLHTLLVSGSVVAAHAS